MHQFLRFLTRDEHPAVYFKLIAIEIGLAEDILNGFALEQALQDFIKPEPVLLRKRACSLPVAKLKSIFENNPGDTARLARAVIWRQIGDKKGVSDGY